MSAIGFGLQFAGMAVGYAGAQGAAEAQKLAGRWNKDVAARNASLLSMAAEDLVFQSNLDITDFRTQYRKFEKETEATIMKSGFDAYSGTGLQILLANADQADENIRRIDYAAQTQAREMREKAVAATLRGDIANFEGQAMARATMAKATASLLAQGSDFAKAGGFKKESYTT